jgi:hypothetical protein
MWVDLFAHWEYQYRPVRKVPSFCLLEFRMISQIWSVLAYLYDYRTGHWRCNWIHSL